MLENIGPNVRRLRRTRDFTQHQLARFAGIHQQYLSAIERGLRPRMALVEKLADALGVQPNDLLRPVDRPSATDEGSAQSATSRVSR